MPLILYRLLVLRGRCISFMNSNLEIIGAKIRFYRNMKKWTQEQLAEKIDSTASYIGQIERGEVNFRIQTVEKIAEALEVSLFSLFEHDHVSEIRHNKWALDSMKLLLQQTPSTQKKLYRMLRELLSEND